MILKSTMTSSKVAPNVRRAPVPTEHRPPGRDEPRPSAHHSKRRNANQIVLADPVKDRVKAWKLIGIIILLGFAGLAYIHHVFRTQEILNEVGRLEQEFEKARRIHADRKFQFERMTGPSEVYRRATQQGFVHGGAAEGVVVVQP